MEKNEKKLFTNEKSNNIMRRKYNPLKANKCEREGLFMKEKDVVLLEELGEKLNFIEKIFFKKKYIRICNKIRTITINAMLK